MVWKSDDNKKYRGKIDRVFVSLTESWEVEYYIDHYLKTRGRALTDDSRSKVAHKLEGSPGRAPHKRDDLTAWLDKEWGLEAK
jgi:hypothetical protein